MKFGISNVIFALIFVAVTVAQTATAAEYTNPDLVRGDALLTAAAPSVSVKNFVTYVRGLAARECQNPTPQPKVGDNDDPDNKIDKSAETCKAYSEAYVQSVKYFTALETAAGTELKSPKDMTLVSGSVPGGDQAAPIDKSCNGDGTASANSPAATKYIVVAALYSAYGCDSVSPAVAPAVVSSDQATQKLHIDSRNHNSCAFIVVCGNPLSQAKKK